MRRIKNLSGSVDKKTVEQEHTTLCEPKIQYIYIMSGLASLGPDSTQVKQGKCGLTRSASRATQEVQALRRSAVIAESQRYHALLEIIINQKDPQTLKLLLIVKLAVLENKIKSKINSGNN